MKKHHRSGGVSNPVFGDPTSGDSNLSDQLQGFN